MITSLSGDMGKRARAEDETYCDSYPDRKRSRQAGRDLLSPASDELLLRVLSFLPAHTLVVCQRYRMKHTLSTSQGLTDIDDQSLSSVRCPCWRFSALESPLLQPLRTTSSSSHPRYQRRGCSCKQSVLFFAIIEVAER